MIGVKRLAPAKRVERVGRLLEADSEAPDRNAQDVQHTQHAQHQDRGRGRRQLCFSPQK